MKKITFWLILIELITISYDLQTWYRMESTVMYLLYETKSFSSSCNRRVLKSSQSPHWTSESSQHLRCFELRWYFNQLQSSVVTLRLWPLIKSDASSDSVIRDKQVFTPNINPPPHTHTHTRKEKKRKC